MTDVRWYDDYPRVAGVFEGGGAKGVAYVGALKAMKKEGWWFDAVAGSSAGALTALAIAAGLDPKIIESKTVTLLEGIKPNFFTGLWNMKNGDGWFRQGKMRSILQEIASSPWRGERDNIVITFRDLFDKTEIQLNIVCADISQNRLVVFNHITTPNCQVVEAALASSAIPFAFKSSLLTVPESEQNWYSTIVDGGVSANFPIFVFNDRAFREYWGYEHTDGNEDVEPRKKIAAFVLGKENNDIKVGGIQNTSNLKREQNKEYYFASFSREEKYVIDDRSLIGNLHHLRFSILNGFLGARNYLYKNRKSSPGTIRPGVGIIAGGLIYGLSCIINPYIPQVNRLRWSPTDTVWKNLLVKSLSRFAGWLAFWYWWIITLVLMTGLMIVYFDFIWTEYKENGDEWIWSHYLSYVSITISVFFFGLISLLLIWANRYLIIPVRQLLYGLSKTYVTGAFAMPWVMCNDWVISLPVPENLGVLSFKAKKEIRDKAIENAKIATCEKLESLIPQWKMATERN